MQPSAKYANYKEMGSCIPSSDLALGRAFMRLDGHRFKNGAKVVASSEFKDPKKTFDFKKVDVLPHYMMNVEPMTLNDFRMMCVFYKSSGFLSAMFSEQDIQVAYMHSQGNWRCAHQILRSYIPIHF
jgi:small subunit ribosomal protein S29